MVLEGGRNVAATGTYMSSTLSGALVYQKVQKDGGATPVDDAKTSTMVSDLRSVVHDAVPSARVGGPAAKNHDLTDVLLGNLTLDEASAAAEGRGLTLEVAGTYSRGFVVVSQTPDAGTRIRRGATVTVRFGPSSVR